jgi:hypothetical protein
VPTNPQVLRVMLKQLCVKVGAPKVELYDLRHGVGTPALARGVDVGTTATLLGHDPAMLLRTYQHIHSADRASCGRFCTEGKATGRQVNGNVEILFPPEAHTCYDTARKSEVATSQPEALARSGATTAYAASMRSRMFAASARTSYWKKLSTAAPFRFDGVPLTCTVLLPACR